MSFRKLIKKTIQQFLCLAGILFLFVLPLTAQESSYAHNIVNTPFDAYGNSLSNVLTAIPSSHAFAHFYNPAQLGNSATSTHLNFYSNVFVSRDLVDTKHSRYAYNFIIHSSSALVFAWKPNSHSNWGLAAGFITNGINFSTDDIETYTSGKNEINNVVNSFSIGATYTNFVTLNVGYSYKNSIEDQINLNFFINDQDELDLNINISPNSQYFHDIGLQLSIPLAKFFSNTSFADHNETQNEVNLLLAYSKRNMGGVFNSEISNRFNALPEQSNWAYALQYVNKNKEETLVELILSAEAMSYTNQSASASDFMKRLFFLSKDDSKINLSTALRIQFLEMLYLSVGERYDKTSTYGMGISFTGALKKLNPTYTSNFLNSWQLNYDVAVLNPEFEFGNTDSQIVMHSLSVRYFFK